MFGRLQKYNHLQFDPASLAAYETSQNYSSSNATLQRGQNAIEIEMSKQNCDACQTDLHLGDNLEAFVNEGK